jgi:hypothetical protein
MTNCRQVHKASRRTSFTSGLCIFASAICSFFTTQAASAQNPAVNTLVFDSDKSGGRSQIYTQTLDVNQTPLNLFQVTSGGGGAQQSQEPQWSLAASAGIDTVGRIAYQFGASGVRGIHLVKPDGTGDIQLTPLPSTGYPCTDARDPSWSPDGRYIVYACLVAPLNNYDIWIHDLGVGTPDNTSDDLDYPLLTLSSSQELRPAWSPDGSMIAFVTNAPGRVGVGSTSKIALVQVTNVNGNVQPFVGTNGPAGSYVLLTDDTFINFSPTWSPDSQQIAFSTTRSGGHDIYRMSARYGIGDPSTFFRLTTSPANDINPAWSSDGRTIAFASDRSGTNQIWTMSAVAGDTDTFDLHQITSDSANDNDPAWNPQLTAPVNTLTLIVPGVTVVSGVARPTGSGTVTVTDGFGHVVSRALVTIVPPVTTVTGTGALAFGLPSPSQTDSNGQLAFTAMESGTEANTADYQFAVAASDPMTGKTGSTTATIRVFAGGGIIPPQPPGPIPVPTQTRLPLGAKPFSPQQKAIFAQLAADFSQKVAGGTKETAGLALTATGLKYLEPLYDFLNPVVGSIGAYDVFRLEMIALDYTYALNLLVLANDPPDPNFTQLALPQVQAPPIIAIGDGPLSPNSVNLMNQSLATKSLLKAYIKALTTSVNRYSTAINAGDLASAELQRNAILAYEDALTPLLQNDANVTLQLVTSFQLAGLPDVQLGASDVAVLQNAVATNGLPSQMIQILQQLGLTPNDVVGIQNSFINTPPASLAGGVFSALQADAATSQTAAVTFAQLSPAIPPGTPVITVAGGTFPYDGTAHAATANATGVSGGPVSGSFTFTYTPGGSSPPVNVGTYLVTAQFTSNDLNYTNSSNGGTITIAPAIPPQTVSSTGSMQFARVSHQATLLADGFVLVSGGQNGGTAIAQSELYNPATRAWSLTGSNIIPRFDHTATLLADGRVLAAGGVSSTGDCTSNVTAETYDPAKGTWSLTGRLPSPVGTGHIAVLLLDGRLLISGGGDRCGNVFNTAAIFDPSTNKWSATGNMTAPREFHSTALLSDGRVLVAGGGTSSPFPVVASADIYDPKTGVWTAVSSMGSARQTSCNGYTQPYLASLTGGAVLAAGGFSGPNCNAITPQRTVSSLTVSPSPALLSSIGQTLALTISAQMSDTSTQLFTGPLQFSSADATVATVDSNGLITSVGAGSTAITVTASGIAPVSVTTTVATRALTSIAVSPTPITLIGTGQTQPLAINGQYSDGSQQALTTGVTFVSSNSAVASVDATGLITSVGNGTAIVTATAQSAPAVQVSVTVKSLVSIAVSPTSITLTTVGQVQPLAVTGLFSDGSQQILTGSLSFVSSNPSVARVDLSGNVTAISIGTATITISLPNVAAVQVPVSVAPTPVVLFANPNSGLQGQQSLSVSLTGQFTNWVQGTTTASFAPGITVTVLTVNSPTGATAVLNIDPAATPGPRTITFTTGTEIATRANGFTILAQTGVLVSVNPPTGQLGQQNLSVSLTGQFTNWLQGTTTASFGAGITVSSLTVNSPTSATAVLTIDPAATAGPRTVTLTTGSEVETLGNGFVISGGPREADAKPFSVLNLAGVTGGQPITFEADAMTFSVLNTSGAGGTGGRRASEADATDFSVLNLAGVMGGKPAPMETDALPFSVLNTGGPGGAGGGSGSLFEIDAWIFSVLNLAGVNGGQPVKMEADGKPFSVKNGP